jgi:hypothetical protein
VHSGLLKAKLEPLSVQDDAVALSDAILAMLGGSSGYLTVNLPPCLAGAVTSVETLEAFVHNGPYWWDNVLLGRRGRAREAAQTGNSRLR